MKEKAIIVDIDGTLTIMNGRNPYDWARVKEDTVNEPVKNMVLKYQFDYKIIIVTARDDRALTGTIEWLQENEIPFDEIYTRPKLNYEKDIIIKKRIYEQNIKDRFDVELVLEDRDHIVDMWRHQFDLTVFQVIEDKNTKRL